jgi:tRNA1(Val) A37 N6-methylase TrmN6
MADTDITEDTILGGRVVVRQPARGYRVNLDTLLLAASLPPEGAPDGSRLVEVGCGVGAALLAVARNYQGTRPSCRFVGVERDAPTAKLARENVALNGLSHCVEIAEVDALSPPAALGVFDRVFFNPPYDEPGEGRAPGIALRHARLADRPIGDWVKVWCNRMASNANLTLIHRARRLEEILDAIEGRLGGATVFPIHPAANVEARRVIVRAWKGSRAPLRLLHGLDLHPDAAAKDKYTPEAEAILRGEAAIWLD